VLVGAMFLHNVTVNWCP